MRDFNKGTNGKLPDSVIIVTAIFLLIFAARVFPYAGSQIPPGYDAGLYKYVIEQYIDNLPGIPEYDLPVWVRNAYPQGLFLLTDQLYLFGLEPSSILGAIFPLLCALLVFPLFIVAREFFGERAGFIAAILYALSATQFHVFSLLYFKNVVGLILMLTSVYLLKRKRYAILALTYAATGAYHRPTFLLLTLVLVARLIQLSVFWAKDRSDEQVRRSVKYLGLAVIAAWTLLAPFYLMRAELYWDVFSSAIGSPSAGTFMDPGTYAWLSLVYLPFAVFGFVWLAKRRDLNLVFLWAAINGCIVVFSLFFYNRFIIHLDIALIMLAAAGLGYVLDSKRVPKMLGVALITAVFAISGAMLLSELQGMEPPISANELDALAWLSDNLEKDSHIITLSSHAPWVLGWGGREVIAPGLFGHDEYSKDEWRDFLRDGSPDKIQEFLSIYDRPLYIYRKRGNGFGFIDFENECFEKVYDGEAIIYRYVC